MINFLQTQCTKLVVLKQNYMPFSYYIQLPNYRLGKKVIQFFEKR